MTIIWFDNPCHQTDTAVEITWSWAHSYTHATVWMHNARTAMIS